MGRGTWSRAQSPLAPLLEGECAAGVHCWVVVIGEVFVLSRPGLDLLPLLPLGLALGSVSSWVLQVLDQLLDSGVSRREADFLVLLGGKHNSTQHAS